MSKLYIVGLVGFAAAAALSVSPANANPAPNPCGGTCPTGTWNVTGGSNINFGGSSAFTGVKIEQTIGRTTNLDLHGNGTVVQFRVDDQQRAAANSVLTGNIFNRYNATGGGLTIPNAPAPSGTSINWVPFTQGAPWQR